MILGDLAALGSALLWAMASVLFAAEGARTRPIVMNLVKSIGAGAVFVLVLLVGRALGTGGLSGPLCPAWGDAGWLLLSGVVGMGIGDTLYFAGLERIGVRRTMMLSLFAPLFAAGASALAGQPLPGAVGAAGILLTLAGLTLFVRAAPLEPARDGGPGRRRSSGGSAGASRRAALGAAAGLGSAFCQALGIVLTKAAIAETGVLSASILRLFAGAAALLLLELLRGHGGAIGRELRLGFTRGRLLLAAFLGTFAGFYLLQAAILLGSPPVVAARAATSPLLAAPVAARYLGERLPWVAALGTLLAVGGVALVLLD